MMKPYPLEASNHLMTPDISTRLAAASPSPENASTAGSRCAPAVYSPGPSLFCSVPPDGGPPSFLDPNSSDPMTPALPHSKKAVHYRNPGPEGGPYPITPGKPSE